MKNVSPLFLNRLTDARASLTKLSRASGAAEAILDDGAAVLSALASRGFDLDELESVWTASPSSEEGSRFGRTNERPPSDETEVSSKTPATRPRGVAFEDDAKSGDPSLAAFAAEEKVSTKASPSLTDASTPMSEFERRFMASYEEGARNASPRSPESVAQGRAATEAAKRAAARALDALEAEDDDDFERFFAKYRT